MDSFDLNQVGGALLDMVRELLGTAGSAAVPPYGAGGVATLVLELDNGYTVTHRWGTDIIKKRAGNEQRISHRDIESTSYSGSAHLSAESARAMRALLARYAAPGSRFLLGLPHEAAVLQDDASGTTLQVDTSLLDWAKPGQRVVVAHLDDDDEPVFAEAVIQSATASAIVLGTAPGSVVGVEGAEIMPAQTIYLEPQQGFPRYPVGPEIWQLDARAATPLDFAPDLASLDLEALTGNVNLAGAIVTSRLFGAVGETLRFGLFQDAGAPDEGFITEPDGEVTFTYKGGTTTLGDLATALENSAYELLTGTYNAAAIIQVADQFAPELLEDAGFVGDVGTGATLDTYEGAPVWDMPIGIETTNTDGIHAMTQIIERGGIPYSLGTADRADWFRAVVILHGDRETWQWFKLFMFTAKLQQKKFWLPTWRADLEYDGHSGTSLTIDADAGDFTAWWPLQRQHIQIEQDDGTITYAEITAAVNNGDGTRTLTISESLSADDVTRIGWLELCRFEGDTYQTRHDQHGFDVQLVARVVP